MFNHFILYQNMCGLKLNVIYLNRLGVDRTWFQSAQNNDFPTKLRTNKKLIMFITYKNVQDFNILLAKYYATLR